MLVIIPLILLIYFLTDFIISLIFIFNLKNILYKLDNLKERYQENLIKFQKKGRRLFKAFPHIGLKIKN